MSRGTGHYGSPQKLSVTRSALKQGPRVITSLPRAGAQLTEGEVVLTISGRPVFLLGGTQPSYRDLGPGMTGRDVRQLETALRRTGLEPGRVDGIYDRATGRAVAALYDRRGFRPLVATSAQLDALQPIEAELVAGNRATGGIQLPADEVMFVSATPLRVAEVAADRGSQPRGALLTATDSQVAVDGALSLDEAKLVHSGMKVLIDEPDLGISTAGAVRRVANQPGTDGVDGFHVFFEVVVDKPPASLIGASVRLTVPVKSTNKAVLAVPVSAISLGPDGASRVQRSLGKLEFIPVEPGLSGEGYVAVTAPRGGLAAGELVVIGIKPEGQPGG